MIGRPTMVCETPISRGPLKGQIATGTLAGYSRHVNAKEAACPDCRTGYNKYMQRWKAANADKHREWSRRWQAANLDKHGEYVRRWRVNNSEVVNRWTAKRRAQKAGTLHVPFTVDQLAERMAYWGNQCWMCKGPYEVVDHVIAIAQGGSDCLSNLRPACSSCNSSKGMKDWREFVRTSSPLTRSNRKQLRLTERG